MSGAFCKLNIDIDCLRTHMHADGRIYMSVDDYTHYTNKQNQYTNQGRGGEDHQEVNTDVNNAGFKLFKTNFPLTGMFSPRQVRCQRLT